MTRTRTVSLTSIACLGMSVLLASCGNGADGVSAGPELTEQEQTQAERVSDDLNALYRTISGPSPAHINAAQLLARRAEQTAMQECMAEKGLNYGPDFLDAPPMFQEEFDDAVFSGVQWLAPLTGDLNLGDSQIDPVSFTRAAVSDFDDYDDESLNEGTDRQSAGCESKAENAFDRYFPPGRDQLYESLSTLVAPYEQSTADAAAASFSRCMKDAGYAIEAPSDLFEPVLSEYPSPREAPSATEAGTDEWGAAHEEELAATLASNECRAPFQQSGLLKLSPALEAWTDSHTGDLVQIKRAWDQKLEEAANYPESSQVLLAIPSIYQGSGS